MSMHSVPAFPLMRTSRQAPELCFGCASSGVAGREWRPIKNCAYVDEISSNLLLQIL